MNHHHKMVNEAAQWEEHREPLRDSIGNRPRQTESPHNPERNPAGGFAGPLSHHDRQASGVASLVVADASGADESRDCWMGNQSCHSSTSVRKIASTPKVIQMKPPPPPPSQPMPPPPPPPPSSQPTIEISPGVYERLRGADETWEAIKDDFYMPAECICCESTIFCIQNADYVLCPECRVVSRMESLSYHGMGGVGLGFKYEDLARWQDAILRDDNECPRPQA
jgi:hypothetical protein